MSHEFIARGGHPLGVLIETANCLIERGGHANDARKVLGARALAPLLCASGDERRYGKAIVQVQGAHASGPVELVGRERERVDTELANVDGDVAHCLHGVCVKGSAMAMRHSGKLSDGFDGAHLVVRQHDRHERRCGRAGGGAVVLAVSTACDFAVTRFARGAVAGCGGCVLPAALCARGYGPASGAFAGRIGAVQVALGIGTIRDALCTGRLLVGDERRLEIFDSYKALLVDGQVRDCDALAFEGLAAVQDGVVLNGAGNDARSGVAAVQVAEPLDGAAQHPVVGFAAAAGEIHLVCPVGSQQLGYASAGGSKRLGRLTRHAVNTARVAERVRQKRHHGLERRG